MNTLRLLALFSLASLSAACGSGDGANGDSSTDDLIGGMAADGPELNAIGSLSGRSAGTYCTATLISPTSVLTAKHCILSDEISFKVGPNSFDAIRSVPAESPVSAEDLADPGASGYGSDVAIYKLTEPITDIEPLAIAEPPGADQIGTQLSFVGYGLKGRNDSGHRQQGTLTLRATSGRPCELAFPSFDDFARFAEGGMDLTRTEAQELCDTPLLEGYEVWVGGASGDAQICDGDSGGPLLAEIDGKKAIVGVASWVYRSKFGACPPAGAAVAVFGSGVRELIDEHR